MQRLIRNKKGLTLIEVVLSITVFAFIAVPLLMYFTNIVALTGKTEKQIDINAITRIIKENVTDAVKKGNGKLPTYLDLNNNLIPTDDDVTLNVATFSGATCNRIINSRGNEYSDYMYDLEPDRNLVPTANFPDTYEYKVTLKKRSTGSVIKVFKISVNTVPDVVD